MADSLDTSAPRDPSDHDYFCYIGCYSLGWENGIPVDPAKRGRGIYIATWNSGSGQLSVQQCHSVETCGGNENPSYLALGANAENNSKSNISQSNSKDTFLYAVHEWEDCLPGAISSHHINTTTGALNTVSAVPCGSHGPCHISCNASNTLVAAANYAGGAVSFVSVDSVTGSLSADVGVVRHNGRECGPNAIRQSSPHAHCVLFSKDYLYLLVADLGTDQILTYAAGSSSGAGASASATTSVRAEAGAGPRGLIWHPSLDILYVAYELLGAVGVFLYSPRDGSLVCLGTYTASEGDGVDIWCGGLCMSSTGKFLYLAGSCWFVLCD